MKAYSVGGFSTEECVLSICVSELGISYGVFNSITSEVLCLKRELDISSFIQDPIVQGDFSKIVLTQVGGKYTLIPDGGAFSVSDVGQFLSAAPESLLVLSLKTIQGQLACIPSPTFTELMKEFPNATVGHSVVWNIENATARNRYLKGIKIYAGLTGTSLELMIFSDTKLIAVVNETCHSSVDAYYHVIKRIEEYKFNQLEDLLYLSGDISAEDMLYKDLKKVVKELRLNAGFKYQKLHKSLGIVPKHQFFNVINAFQCES